MVETECGKLYTGIATDVDRRFSEHQQMYVSKSGRGAKYFRGHEPKHIIWKQELENRSTASVREAEIKKMSASAKRRLISQEK